MGATWWASSTEYLCLFRWVCQISLIKFIGILIIDSLLILGQAIGNVVMLAVSGIIASSSLGWPGIFYISGGFGLLWTVVWIIFGSNSPEVDPRISNAEKDYIQMSLGQITDVEELKVRWVKAEIDHRSNTVSFQSLQTPWKSILTSIPFLSIMIVHCSQNWGFYTMLTEIPSYLNYVMKFNIKQVRLKGDFLLIWICSDPH